MEPLETMEQEVREMIRRLQQVGQAIASSCVSCRLSLQDERYLSGEQVCEYLHLSKRTLQCYRDEGILPYTTIGGKILYPENELYKLLEKNYVKSIGK